jgi:putative NADH-flavin reductase
MPEQHLRIAVLGATGSIGSAIVSEALDRGHEVVAVVRDPSKLQDESGVEVVQAEAHDEQAIGDVAGRVDVVVSALGGGKSGNPGLVADVAPGILRAVGPKARLFWVGGAGSLLRSDGIRVADHPDFPDAWRAGSNAQAQALEIIRDAPAEVDWTYLSPANSIEPGERTGSYRTDEEHLVTDDAGVSRITIPDYAVAALDELETPRFRRQRFTIGY